MLYKLLNNPKLRQRYLAHYRTIVNEEMDTTQLFQMIDDYYSMIDPVVQNDPVSNYTYSEFLDHREVLKDFIIERKDFIKNNSEYDVESPVITNTIFYTDTTAWQRPQANQAISVVSSAFAGAGIEEVNLYFADGLVGKFAKTEMFDDGLHNDQLPGDGIYGSTIPGYPGGTWIRFYVEAISDNSSHTASYDPPGAEHDIYTFLVLPSIASDTSIVINELMAINTSTVTDSSGEYADWIELFNNSGVPKDISGYFLTDNSFNLIKWQIPAGTILPAFGYLIIWADEHSSEGQYHTNFKLSNSGENLLLLNAIGELVDEVTFGPQVSDMGYARMPNGTGAFVIQSPTFSISNSPILHVTFPTIAEDNRLNVFPNPANNYFVVDFKNEASVQMQVLNALGEIIYKENFDKRTEVKTEHWTTGVYFIRIKNNIQVITIQH